MQATTNTDEVLDPPDLLSRLEHSLVSSAKRVLGRVRPGAPGRQVERTGYYALARLEACGEVRLSELAGTLELDVSTVSRQVRLLEDLGLLERTPDPHDGRASLLGLSAAGRHELAVQRSERHAVLERAITSWPATDRHRLLDLLERLSTSLAELPGTPCQDAAPRPNREVSA